MQAIKAGNLVLRFVLELCLLAVFGFWGFSAGQSTAMKIGLAIGALLTCAIIWGIFLAPASSRRLHEPWRLILELILFGLAILALYRMGQYEWAGVFGLVYGINKILLRVWGLS
jgi:hypothetical protein